MEGIDLKSILKELEKFNKNKLNLMQLSSDRYTIHYQDSKSIKTAYCFSVPIHNIETNEIVDFKLSHISNESTFIASESKIIINEKVTMFNQYGKCNIIIQGKLFKRTNEAILFKNGNEYTEIRPTINGIMLIATYNPLSAPPKIILQFNNSFENVKQSSKFFSVMREKFTPFIIASSIGTIDASEKVIMPCAIHSEKINDTEFILSIHTESKSKVLVAIEINMHETKLFQDTTVESKHSDLNNAFGGISFLGRSNFFGEQILYSRLEFSNIPYLQNKKIYKSVLHIPNLGNTVSSLTVNKLSDRFCSFGSNWETKTSITNTIAHSTFSNGYYHLDLTTLLGDFNKSSENFAIQCASTNKYVVIPTADNFYTPQILEVKYQ
jgi:hypothetical protein